MQRGCFYMNVSMTRTDHLLQKSFDVIFNLVFLVMPDKVADLITAVTGETAISPAPTAPPAGRESICICKSL